jgi:NAD(P)-dependent dehydrogenase (short-subunit alcohol dehydrogenase family)
MNELRFDGRVAIVTGAGGQPPSLGRSYAHLLASRGAKVLVNDLGIGPVGRQGVLEARADVVAQEIVNAGGQAIADTHSVAESAAAKAVVQTAIDAWGQVDILINNAGIVTPGLFEDVSTDDHEKVVQSHLMGNIWMCRAVWPHMKQAGYGRIVNITSAAAFGVALSAVYGAAKAGIFGLSCGLAIEGATHNIKVNALGPRATTAKHAYLAEQSGGMVATPETWLPEQVAQVVAYLAHADCPVTGRFLNAAGGQASETVLGLMTRGYTNPALTIEDVRDNFATIIDRTDLVEMPEIAYHTP